AAPAVAPAVGDAPRAAAGGGEAAGGPPRLGPAPPRRGGAAPAPAAPPRRCVEIAAERVPRQLGPCVAALAELVESGRCPGDLISERIDEIGPHAAFEELAHA